MTTKINISLPLDETLLNQAETLAQELNISQNQLFELALEKFIRDYEKQSNIEQRQINQGDVYWLQLEAGIAHPHVVIQENVLNHSRIKTTVVSALTTNLKRVNMPGNILLDTGEANLPKQSLVEVSKVTTVDKTQLGEYIGSLSAERVLQILAGMRFLQSSFYHP